MSKFVHGDNIARKENAKKTTVAQHKLLEEIRVEYEKWKTANLGLKGPLLEKDENDTSVLEERVRLLNAYKDFIDKKVYAEAFDSRSNLHSTVLEEFIYFLFKDLVADISGNAIIGKSHAYKDIFYQSTSFKSMITEPSFKIEKKDHDFIIGVNIDAKFRCKGETTEQKEKLEIPAVAIECKTYLDKTMLEEVSTAGSQLLIINPNAKYFVVAERLKLTDAVNLKKYKVDQIFILRKMKNVDREFRLHDDYENKPIYADVVESLFNAVRNHLSQDWKGSTSISLETGMLL